MKILFYDLATPTPYDLDTLRQQGLGGTEATVVRVAHALQGYHEVYIAQHCRPRNAEQSCQTVKYLSLESAHALDPEVVVLLRHYRQSAQVAKLFPKARKFLWLHNMPSRDLYAELPNLKAHQFELLAVSRFHKGAIEKRLRGKAWLRLLTLRKAETLPSVHVLYNPIDEHLKPDKTAWKPDQLLFMSSPQKGLEETLKVFAKVREHFPEYKLLISNPGYNLTRFELPEQAEFLGVLPHHQVIQTLRESFCVFYPQQERVETFGLVYAEANAVGTPVLAHDSGAASEVLSDGGQLVDGSDIVAILAKLKEWRAKRPVLRAREEFRLSRVLESWLELLR